VECLNSGDKTWIREVPVQLIHEDTNTYLSSYTKYQFGHPIPGQLEVASARSASKESQWMTQVSFSVSFLYFCNALLMFFFSFFYYYYTGRSLFCCSIKTIEIYKNE
jgi:hypothetical protein